MPNGNCMSKYSAGKRWNPPVSGSNKACLVESSTGWCWLEPWRILWLSRNSWERECHHPNWRTPWFFRGVGRLKPPSSHSNWLTDAGNPWIPTGWPWVNTAPGYTVWWKNLQLIIILPNMFKDLVIFFARYIPLYPQMIFHYINNMFFSTRLIVAVRCGLCIGILDNIYIYIYTVYYILLSHYIPYFLSPDL